MVLRTEIVLIKTHKKVIRYWSPENKRALRQWRNFFTKGDSGVFGPCWSKLEQQVKTYEKEFPRELTPGKLEMHERYFTCHLRRSNTRRIRLEHTVAVVKVWFSLYCWSKG